MHRYNKAPTAGSSVISHQTSMKALFKQQRILHTKIISCAWVSGRLEDWSLTSREGRLSTRLWTPPPKYLPNSLALLCSMSPLPFALTVPTLKKKLVTMPNIGQGIIKSHPPTQEATKKMLLSSKSHCYDQRSFSARISIRRQDFTKTETLLKPHPSCMTVVV